MKKITLYLVALLFINCQLSIIHCKAQPNSGFEIWNNVLNYQTTDSWQTLNFLSAFTPPNPISAFKATGVDKHSGNYALKIKTVYINNNPVPESIPDSIGYVFLGKVLISPPAVKLGVPYTGRPEKLQFWSKYMPVAEDEAGVFVTLQKWNGTTRDTIGYGDIKIYSTLTYTLFNVDIFYESTELPDTLIIGFASSYKQSKARIGSTLYIDDVELTGWVGIDEQDSYTDKVQLFPNPAKENITIHTQLEEADHLRLFDAAGKSEGVYKIQNSEVKIITAGLADGFYFFEIQDKKHRILTKGKFNVVK